MMNLTVNSEAKQFSGKTIADLLRLLNITDLKGTALAVNEKVITKNEWGKFQLNENDNILIIKATQGG